MIKSEVIIKTDSTINWEKAVNYIPTNGTILVYDDGNTAPKIKIGNGVNKVNELPFLVTPPCVNQDILKL